MLIQWRDGQQTFQNVYFIFTSKNPMDGSGSRNDEQFDEFEMTTSARSQIGENAEEELEEYEEDKYVLKKR